MVLSRYCGADPCFELSSHWALLNSSAHSFVCMYNLSTCEWTSVQFNIVEFCKKLLRNSSLFFDHQFY